MKKILLLTLCLVTLCVKTSRIEASQALVPAAPSPELISETYKLIHNLVQSTAITVYYTITDCNDQNQNAHEWDIDLTTIISIIARTIAFTIINYYTMSYIPDHRKLGDITKDRLDHTQRLVDLAGQTCAMLTYNAHFKKMVIDRYYEVKTELEQSMSKLSAQSLSMLNILFRNLIYWYTIPLFLKRVNHVLLANLPRQQQASNIIFSATQSVVLAHLAFSAMDLLYQHILMSIKHTISQFVPRASNFNIGRFEDCTACYLGTNMFGRSGPVFKIAGALETVARNTPKFLEGLYDQMMESNTPKVTSFTDLNNPLITTHTTQPYCGLNNPACVF